MVRSVALSGSAVVPELNADAERPLELDAQKISEIEPHWLERLNATDLSLWDVIAATGTCFAHRLASGADGGGPEGVTLSVPATRWALALRDNVAGDAPSFGGPSYQAQLDSRIIYASLESLDWRSRELFLAAYPTSQHFNAENTLLSVRRLVARVRSEVPVCHDSDLALLRDRPVDASQAYRWAASLYGRLCASGPGRRQLLKRKGALLRSADDPSGYVALLDVLSSQELRRRVRSSAIPGWKSAALFRVSRARGVRGLDEEARLLFERSVTTHDSIGALAALWYLVDAGRISPREIRDCLDSLLQTSRSMKRAGWVRSHVVLVSLLTLPEEWMKYAKESLRLDRTNDIYGTAAHLASLRVQWADDLLADFGYASLIEARMAFCDESAADSSDEGTLISDLNVRGPALEWILARHRAEWHRVAP